MLKFKDERLRFAALMIIITLQTILMLSGHNQISNTIQMVGVRAMDAANIAAQQAASSCQQAYIAP